VGPNQTSENPLNGARLDQRSHHYANNDPIGHTDPSGLQPTDQTFALPQPRCTNHICVAGFQTETRNLCPNAGPVPTVPYVGVPTIPCVQLNGASAAISVGINRASISSSFAVAVKAQQDQAMRKATLCLYARGTNCESGLSPLQQYARLLEARSSGFPDYQSYVNAIPVISALNDVLGEFASKLKPLYNSAFDAIGNVGFWAGAIAVVAFATCPITLGVSCAVAGAASSISTAAGFVTAARSCLGRNDQACVIGTVSAVVGAKTGSETAGRAFGSALQSFVSLVLGQEADIRKYGVCDVYKRNAAGYCQ
jgi:hypothetical protein